MSLWDQINQPVTYAIPFFLLAITLEALALRRHDDDRAGFERVDARTSIAMGAVSVLINGGAKVVALLAYSALYTVTPFQLDSRDWRVWVGVMVGVDLLFYAYHRVAHRVRIVWASHQAHHNSRHYNFSTALRQKWNPWFELMFWAPLPLLGVPPWMIFTAFSANLVYQFWVHTETVGRLPRWVEFVFNTPSHHRVHHGSDAEYLDRNYGGILIVWDRLFGTFREETFRPTYGLTTNIETSNLLTLQFHEFGSWSRDMRSTRRVRDWFGYTFGPPGWQPAPQFPGSTPARTTSPDHAASP